ncbi:hypothetical protein [Palleronia sp.]|uniref:hypothetical protein n=1 Tax=Palleronia sp. TaxID=1940284 RepID=UPI0035C81815
MEPSATLLVAAAAFSGITAFRRWRQGPLNTADSARDAWRAVYPGDRVRASIIGEDGRTALVETDWGCGLICRRGRVARRLDKAETDIGSDGLNIHLGDIDVPRVTVKLSPADAATWHDKIAES